ncbi:MAG: polysaccharide deacetylase family protein [Planctomycetaceae bacterium]|jgi:peptidoglycan/xylan/chitin deacetylase (PgdA/CDA1 family)|nr:polysaccharide deacetylase family protein [Planctomycetaceae bacterium]
MNMKQIILNGTEVTGLNSLARYLTRKCLLGLCYHSVVSDNSPQDDARTRIAVTVSQFNEQLQELRRHWNPVSLRQIRDAIEEKVPLPVCAVHVSFDDGYQNNLTLAAPLLARYEIPATIFVTTNLINSHNQMIWAIELHERLVVLPDSSIVIGGQTYQLSPCETPQRTRQALNIVNQVKSMPVEEREFLLQYLRNRVEVDLVPFWKRELYEFLNWDELRLLQKQGIEIGSHTLSHPILSNLDAAALESEIRGSKECIERELGVECNVFAYPFGASNDFSDQVIDVVRRVGFNLAFTLQERRNAAKLDAMRIHRICINREHSIASFRVLISGLRNSSIFAK